MPLFACSKCGTVENTALSSYWTRPKGSPALCSACDPECGKRWHGQFPRRTPEECDLVVDPESTVNAFLIKTSELAMRAACKEFVIKERIERLHHMGEDEIARYFFEAGWIRGMSFQQIREEGSK